MKLISTQRAKKPRRHNFLNGRKANIFDVIFIVEIGDGDKQNLSLLNGLQSKCKQVRRVRRRGRRYTIIANPITREGLRAELQTHCPTLASLIQFYNF